MSKAIRQTTPSELRALDVFDHVPAGCKLELVVGEYNSPHLRSGEFAVVDLADRDIINGELYLIRWRSGGRALRCVTRRQHEYRGQTHDGIWFSPLRKARYLPSGALDWNGPVFLSDGPLDPAYWPEYVMGRVIGIFQAPEIDDRDALPPPDLGRRIEG